MTASYKGSCNCGAVAFTVNDVPNEPISTLPFPWFNAYCHCRACSRARGASPSHLFGVPASHFSITKGASRLKAINGRGKMIHAFCTHCGCHIYQHLDGVDYRAVFPANFHIETNDASVPCGVSCKLPKQLWPTQHFNYENRLMNATDDLPKYTTFQSSPRLNNDGSLYQEEKNG